MMLQIVCRFAFLLGVAVAGSPLLFAVQAGKTTEKSLDWSQFRGPKRDGHSADTGLLQEWPSSGPPLAWKTTGIGIGFSSVSSWGNKVFTMGEDGGKCHLVALNAGDGKVVWKLPVAGELADFGVGDVMGRGSPQVWLAAVGAGDKTVLLSYQLP